MSNDILIILPGIFGFIGAVVGFALGYILRGREVRFWKGMSKQWGQATKETNASWKEIVNTIPGISI